MTNARDSISATTQAQDGPRGIGGWLILPIISLVFALATTIYNLYGAIVEWEGVKAIITGSHPTAAALRLPMGASVLTSLATMGLIVLCLHRIFTRSPAVPRLMTIFYIGMVVACLVDLLAGYRIAALTETQTEPDSIKDVIRALIASAIWIPYFHRSRRVANTFRTREAAIERKIREAF